MLKILVVDDEPEITELVRTFFLRKGYDVSEANDGKTALELVRQQRPHLVFLDIRMPGADGLTVLENIREIAPSVKVIIVSALEQDEIVAQAMDLGAVDYVRKPFKLDYLQREVIEKVNSQLFGELREQIKEKSFLVDQLASEIERVNSLNEKLKDNFYQTVLSLAAALEARDQYTHGHSDRVDRYSALIARELRDSEQWPVDQVFLEALRVEARLHDIGKIAVPDAVLNKPGRLAEEEFAMIKEHPVKSAHILAPLEDMKESVRIIRHHHERIDGRGYPSGLGGDDIPVRARIIAVADAFDAMTSDRPYRQSMPFNHAMDELLANKDTQFQGEIVDAFVKAWKDGKVKQE